MRRPRLGPPSPALVVSILALIVALGGTSYAAVTRPHNSVGTKQLKNGAVTGAKIKSGAVTSKAIKNGAVSGAKVAAGSLTGRQINASTLGPVPNATHASTADNATHASTADNATHASTADNATHASTADNASALGGLTANQFVQGGGVDVSGRVTLIEGGGGLQHIVTVTGFGEVVGGCGSGGGEVGFVNHFGHDLQVSPFAGTDIAPVTISDGASSGLFPSGAGSAGTTMLQIGSTDFTDQQILTVIATRDADVSGRCNVQAWAVVR
jgi:hypothetical protein